MRFSEGYHWSVMQAEYALDIVFRQPEDLHPIYEEISRQAVLAVKIDDMARFWDKRLSPEAAASSRFSTRVEGTCIRHHLGKQSITIAAAASCASRVLRTTSHFFVTTARWSTRGRPQSTPRPNPWRVRPQRPQYPAPTPTAHRQNTGPDRSHPQTPPPARADSPRRPHLPILSDQSRSTRAHGRPNAQGAAHHPGNHSGTDVTSPISIFLRILHRISPVRD
jgi:hypothetical protein